MRVYDTQIKTEGDGFKVEVTEYHDERGDFVGPRRWHARVQVRDDSRWHKLNFNAETQAGLYLMLAHGEAAFESARSLVLEPAAAQ
jgi:hypothetical protein